MARSIIGLSVWVVPATAVRRGDEERMRATSRTAFTRSRSTARGRSSADTATHQTRDTDTPACPISGQQSPQFDLDCVVSFRDVLAQLCMFARVCASVHARVHAYVCICVYGVCASVHAYVYICVYGVSVSAYVRVYVCVCICMCVWITFSRL